METLETGSLTVFNDAASSYAKFLDKFPEFVRFDIERWVDDIEASMARGKKRGFNLAFPQDVQVDESKLSFKVATAMMDEYASGDYKFSERIRAIIKKQGMEYFKRKCIKMVAWNINDDKIGRSVSSIGSDSASEEESAGTSGSSKKSSVSSGSDIEEPGVNKAGNIKIERKKHRPVRRYMIYRTINGERKLIFFKLCPDHRVKIKWDPKDPNRSINRDPERYIRGFDYQRSHSLPADEKLELEPFPDYVEPDPAEFSLITEDVLELGTSSIGASRSSSDSSLSSSSTENDSDSSNEVVNFQPLSKKPRYEFTPSSGLSSKLPDFLASMKAANDSLQADIIAGNQEHRLEIEDATDSKGEKERPYIEMDLGLGVLEEKANHSDSSESSSNKAHDNEIKIGSVAGKPTAKKPLIIEEL